MLLDLSQMREARGRIDRTIAPEDIEAKDEDVYRVLKPVHLAFDIHKDGPQFHLVGSVESTLGLNCSRCLEDFTFPVHADFDLLYLPHSENLGEGEVEVEDDDLTTAYYQDEQIDLGHLIREQFYLAVPMKALCQEACRGLCPACGTNLNTGSCDCSPNWTDPRLEQLKSLLDRDKRDREV